MKRFLVLSTLLFLVSCSIETNRGPASNDAIFESHSGQVTVEFADDIAESSQNLEEGFSEELRAEVDKMNKGFASKTDGYTVDLRSMKVEVEYVDDLPGKSAYVLDTKVDEFGNHIIQVFASKKATHDMTAQDEIKGLLRKIVDNEIYPNPFGFFETMMNARAGHKPAQAHLLQIHHGVLTDVQEDIDGEPLQKKVADVEERILEIEKDLKVLKKEAKKLETSRKDIMKTLDKVAADGQLKSLMQSNDREGVAALLEKYIPREQMTPMEHKFWDFTLNKIRTPVDYKNRVIMYRGTDGDRLYPMIKDGVELSKEDAIKQGKMAAMSTILTRNQGTWNRRLRSIQTMYGKDFSKNPYNEESKFVESARLTTWMKQHADQPQGSIFLSFSSKYEVAHRFGKESLGAFLVDPEVIVFNQMTDYKGEMEFLHTLISFPDEMVSYFDHEVHGKLNREQIEDKIHKDLKNFLKEKYADDSEKIYKSIITESDAYVDSKRAFLVPENQQKKGITQTNKKVSIWRRLWNWVRRKDEPLYELKEETYTVKGNPNKLTCSYALMSFLK